MNNFDLKNTFNGSNGFLPLFNVGAIFTSTNPDSFISS